MASAALGTLWGVPIKTNDFILSGNSKAYSRANIPPIEIPHKWIWPWVLLQYSANKIFFIVKVPFKSVCVYGSIIQEWVGDGKAYRGKT